MSRNRIIEEEYYDDRDHDFDYPYLSPQEVMALLNIGKNTFYRQLKSGKLKAFRIGRLWRVSRKELERYTGENY